MQISSFSWHARVYKWWLNKKPGWSHPRSHNLCLYVRAVLIWAPLRWLFLQGKIGPLHVTAASWPIILGAPLIFIHSWKILFPVLLFYLSCAISCLILGGIVVAVKLQEREFPKPIESFLTVLREYLKAGHEKICPFIEFK